MKRIILFFSFLLSFYLFCLPILIADDRKPGAEWIGKNRDLFRVNPDGRIQPDIKPSTSGSLSIGQEIRYSPDMQWEFDVHMRYLPSDKNKLCVFLYQENADRFYYVRVGFSGNRKLGLRRYGDKDLFEWKESGFDGAPLLLHIKVTLEKNEKWTLYSRLNDRQGYRLEGSCVYPITEPPAAGTMIFTFYYTKTRSDLFSIGTVTVSDRITPMPLEGEIQEDPEADKDEQGDEVLPKLIKLDPVSLDALRFSFDKAVGIDKAVFHISDIGNAYLSKYSDERTKTAVLAFFNREMTPGKDYTISYSGLYSERGTVMPPYSVTVGLKAKESPSEKDENPPVPPATPPVPEVSVDPGEVVFNELLPDPYAGGSEYIEFYNRSDRPLSLSGLAVAIRKNDGSLGVRYPLTAIRKK